MSRNNSPVPLSQHHSLLTAHLWEQVIRKYMLMVASGRARCICTEVLVTLCIFSLNLNHNSFHEQILQCAFF